MIDTPHPSDAEPPSFLGGEYSAIVEGLQLEASLVLQGHLGADKIPVTLSDKPSAELIDLSGEYPEGESLISYRDGVTAYVINNPL